MRDCVRSRVKNYTEIMCKKNRSQARKGRNKKKRAKKAQHGKAYRTVDNDTARVNKNLREGLESETYKNWANETFSLAYSLGINLTKFSLTYKRFLLHKGKFYYNGVHRITSDSYHGEKYELLVFLLLLFSYLV